MGSSRTRIHSLVRWSAKLRAPHYLIMGLIVIALIAGLRLRERLVVPEVEEPEPLLVETERTASRPFVVTTSYSGTIEADRRATVSSRLVSSVNNVYVKAGDAVEEGQLLFRLDDTEQRQELRRLQAAADRIRADLKYWRGQLEIDENLFSRGTISEQKLEESKRRVATLTASLEENRQAVAMAETRLGYAEVVAPFTAVVQALLVDEGETVNPGSPLLELVDTASLKAVVSAPQSDRQRVTTGLRTYLQLHQQATLWQGEIHRIHPAMDSLSRNFTFEVPFRSDTTVDLHAGMSVKAEVEVERMEAVISVPLHAVQQRKGRDGVFAIRGGEAVWSPVTTGSVEGERVQLIEGVGQGELVITTPYPALESGRAVRVSPYSSEADEKRSER
ncbi:MAG: efflux RND transporter periplasmic adaptor subunit [Pseudomonadota bacterium]